MLGAVPRPHSREPSHFSSRNVLLLAAAFFAAYIAIRSLLNGVSPLELTPGKKHILVTGGAGFIGSHAALRLLSDGHSVTIIVRPSCV